MGTLEIGKEYNRDFLSSTWGYKGRQAISRGIITPADEHKIILFVTNIKQKSDTQYNNYFIEEGILHMEGESNHSNDQRLINSELNNDSIYLFYRNIHHTPFVYYGRVFLVDYKTNTDRPSTFILSTSASLAIGMSSLSTEQNKTNYTKERFISDKEGAKRVELHVRYERSLKNRAKAIEIHGTNCKVCGFNFNEFYGSDLARHFIEVHHITPLSRISEEQSIDPARDLIPLCSNCHSMIHRQRDIVMSVEELQKRITRKKNSFSKNIPY
jgi:5-methylcytosine-specific restriction protein A